MQRATIILLHSLVDKSSNSIREYNKTMSFEAERCALGGCVTLRFWEHGDPYSNIMKAWKSMPFFSVCIDSLFTILVPTLQKWLLELNTGHIAPL